MCVWWAARRRHARIWAAEWVLVALLFLGGLYPVLWHISEPNIARLKQFTSTSFPVVVVVWSVLLAVIASCFGTFERLPWSRGWSPVWEGVKERVQFSTSHWLWEGIQLVVSIVLSASYIAYTTTGNVVPHDTSRALTVYIKTNSEGWRYT